MNEVVCSCYSEGISLCTRVHVLFTMELKESVPSMEVFSVEAAHTAQHVHGPVLIPFRLPKN